jgi:hypothetical protein
MSPWICNYVTIISINGRDVKEIAISTHLVFQFRDAKNLQRDQGYLGNAKCHVGEVFDLIQSMRDVSTWDKPSAFLLFYG